MKLEVNFKRVGIALLLVLFVTVFWQVLSFWQVFSSESAAEGEADRLVCEKNSLDQRICV